MSKYITVGFDGSPESRDAVEWAADEAVARGCRLKIVTCCRTPVGSEVNAGKTADTDTCCSQMEAANVEIHDRRREILRSHPDLDVCTEVCAGRAGEVLAVAGGDDLDLIVLGASSHKGSSAFWLGSTPRTVVHRALRPVVVVRGHASPARPVRVVVGTDGSEHATQAVRWATAEADLHGVALLVVHAWDYPYDVTPRSGQHARELIEHDAKLVLKAAVDTAQRLADVEVAGEMIEGTPHAALLGVVRNGDLLVLGSRGRGLVSAGLFGSTVNSVLDRADVPVAVIPSVHEN
jgi:nucleotide-binding universal stress UspA family protein